MASTKGLSLDLRKTTIKGAPKKRGPSLLVSVRSVAEARSAYEGGAAVIDIKEPRNGALGAAREATITEIVAFIDGQRPVTAALGELEEIGDKSGFPGVAAVKVGLAGLGRTDWREKLGDFSQTFQTHTELVPAAYADWQAAGAPEPSAVIEATAKLGLSWVLLDTWNKSAGELLAHCPKTELVSLLSKAHRHGLQMVLAGRLRGDSLCRVGQLGPDLVGVRSAVCTGGRDGQVTASLVELAVQSILRQDQLPPINDPAKMAGNPNPLPSSEPPTVPKFNVDIPNPLGKDEALNRLQGFSDKLREKYQDQISDLEQSWEGDRLDFAFKTFGIKIAGALTVEQEKVLVEGDLPFSAVMFKGKITSGIEEQLGKLLT